jgi:hypothetical protein
MGMRFPPWLPQTKYQIKIIIMNITNIIMLVLSVSMALATYFLFNQVAQHHEQWITELTSLYAIGVFVGMINVSITYWIFHYRQLDS